MGKFKPFVSLIMPNFNNEHVLDLFFSKLVENNTYDNYELIITDDGSEDDSLKILKKWQDLKLIKNMTVFEEPHKGIINALNKCLYAAKGDFIIRLDGDATIETKGFIEKFLKFYSLAPDKIGVITTKVIFDNGKLHAIGRDIISPAGLCDRGKKPFEKIGERTFDCNFQVLGNLNEIIDLPAECDTAIGVCTFSDKKTALKIGGFDYNYPLWIEDDDFYLSYRLHNKKCFYLPDINICHRTSIRGSRVPQKQSLKERLIINYRKIIYNMTHSIFILGLYFDIFIVFWNILPKKILFSHVNPYITKILLQNYKYWKKKWGFDILNPNVKKIKEKYKNTEIIWAYDDNLKQKGLDIINKYIALKENN